MAKAGWQMGACRHQKRRSMLRAGSSTVTGLRRHPGPLVHWLLPSSKVGSNAFLKHSKTQGKCLRRMIGLATNAIRVPGVPWALKLEYRQPGWSCIKDGSLGVQLHTCKVDVNTEPFPRWKYREMSLVCVSKMDWKCLHHRTLRG